MRCIYYMIRVHFSHLYTAVDTLVPESRICLCVSLCVNVYICALKSRGLSFPRLLCPFLRSWRAGVFSVMRICFSATLRYASAMSRPNFTEVYYFSHQYSYPLMGSQLLCSLFSKHLFFSTSSSAGAKSRPIHLCLQ